VRIFAIVSQHNWQERKTDGRGREYIAVTHRAPESTAEAREWAAEDPNTCRIVEAESPHAPWGTIAYEEVDGEMVQVAYNVDSSG
jgi:hypothetical protein